MCYILHSSAADTSMYPPPHWHTSPALSLFLSLQTHPRENVAVTVDDSEVCMFRSYYSNLMYKVRL